MGNHYKHRLVGASNEYLQFSFYGEHYENTPMQNRAIFYGRKNDNFQLKYFVFFQIFAKNMDCGYTLEPAVLTSTHLLYR